MTTSTRFGLWAFFHTQIRLNAINTLRELCGPLTFLEEHVEVILSMLDVVAVVSA